MGNENSRVTAKPSASIVIPQNPEAENYFITSETSSSLNNAEPVPVNYSEYLVPSEPTKTGDVENLNVTTLQEGQRAFTTSQSNLEGDDDESTDLVSLLFSNGASPRTEGATGDDIVSQYTPWSTGDEAKVDGLQLQHHEENEDKTFLAKDNALPSENNEFSPIDNVVAPEKNDADKVESRKSLSVRFFASREINSGKVIGEGGFGRVLKGVLGGKPVAIKLFHAPIALTEVHDELNQLMSAKHKNLVSLYGIVTQTDALDCPQVVFQYFPEGNILQYLSRKENPDDTSTLGKFGLDIAEGCQYLAEKKIIHGNLAARNILVERIIGRQKTYHNAKISDTGIIRFAEASGGNYLKLPGSDRIIPIRWVPKEIVEEQEDGTVGSDFTLSSDMWGFGVVLWEIWTRGAIPYGASYSNLFLKDGYSPLKIHRPSDCPAPILSAMEEIFKVDPAERPTFEQLSNVFQTFKGYGKDNPKVGKILQRGQQEGAGQRSGVSVEDPPLSPGPAKYDQSPKTEEKATKKKKKNKNKPNVRYNQGVNQLSEQVDRTLSLDEGARGAHTSEAVPTSPPATSFSRRSGGPPAAESIAEPTIAGLLARVNLLENDRLGRGSGLKSERWQRRPGPPRFNRGAHSSHLYTNSSGGNNGRPGMEMAGSSPLPGAQAPPPYSEEPLPHHSSARYPTQDYGYTPNSSPGPSRGRGYLRSRGASRPDHEGPPGGDIFVRRIKRLAEEIEVLRAEKMTQELLKKSAELADLMKFVAGGAPSGSGPADDSTVVDQSGPPGGFQGRYYYNDYDYGHHSPTDGNSRWSGQRQDGENRHYHDSEQQHQTQQSQQQYRHRPYYKGPGRGHRGYGKHGGGGGGDWSSY